MRELVVKPEQATITASVGSLAIGTGDLALRLRRGFYREPFEVKVGWSVAEDRFNYLQAFYRRATANGSLPFIIELPLNGILSLYKAKFSPGSFSNAGKETIEYDVTAQLFVVPYGSA